MRLFRTLTASVALAAALAGCGHPTSLSANQLRAADPGALGDFDMPENAAPSLTLSVPSGPAHPPDPMTAGNAATLYVSAPQTLPQLKAMILGAKHSLYFETFNFGNDSMGQQIYPLLAQRAKEGLEVKVLVDFVGTRFLPGYGKMRDAMRQAGVEFRVYAPRTIVKDDKRVGINITHRKVYLADGEHGLIGGVNLMKGFDTTTQDVLTDWHGPIVGSLYQEFTYDWKAANGGALNQAVVPPTVTGGVHAQVVVTSPREGRFEGRDAIIAAVSGAHDSISIENQYLWDAQLMAALHAALKRGVKVRVVVPGEEDHGVFKYIHTEEVSRLIDDGAQARLYNGAGGTGHLHVKYFGIDGHWVASGSTNGDTRALMDNQELDTVIDDGSLAMDFQQRLFETDWASNTLPFVYKPGKPNTKAFQTLFQILEYYT